MFVRIANFGFSPASILLIYINIPKIFYLVSFRDQLLIGKQSQSIWHPVVEFADLLKYEKTKVYGDSATFSLWYMGNKKFEYSEEIKLTFFCNLHFMNFPIDSHECHLEYGDDSYGTEKILLNSATIGYADSKTNLGKDPIIITDLPFPYEFQLESLPSFNKEYQSYGNFSYTGMNIKMRRKFLGQLLSSYYYPTGSFALLSLISFLINPDQVIFR